MIPLSVFLIAWLVLLGVYGILSLLSIIQMLRFAISGPMVYLSTFLFILVSLAIIGGTGLYLSHVDWSLPMNLGSLLPLEYFDL